MNRFLQKVRNSLSFKKRATRIAFIGLVAIVLSQATMPLDLLASGPQFNILPGDYKLIRGANATAGETNWHNPVIANPNDSVAVIVYFHNGVIDTTAENTMIKVDLPSSTKPAKDLTLTGHLWADNAAEVTDTMNIDSTQSVFANYIPGTTQIFKNGSQTGTQLPDGITTNGVNIGNINGCWQYSGYVVFQVKIMAPGVPDLTIQKTVADSTTEHGTQNWVKQDTANPGDVLAYKLYFLNPGTDTANNVKISDILPDHVTYIPGTTKLYTNATGTNGQLEPDAITTSNLSLGNLQPGGDNSGYIVFQVKIDPNLAVGNYTLLNTGKIWASNVTERQDTATTLININGNVDTSISKYVRNVSENQANFVKENTATNGNTLEYKLNFTTSGNTQAKDVKISDVLPNVSGIPVSYINGSTELFLNGSETKLTDTITTSGVSLGDLNSGTQGYIIFDVKIADNATPGQYNLINTGIITADNASTKQDTASTCLTITPPPMPYMSIVKYVRDDTKNETDFVKANVGNAGDTLEYKIWIKNTGQAPATQILVKDVIPSLTTYINGSTKEFINNSETNMPDGITGNGIIVANLGVGAEEYVTFQVLVSKDTPNNTVLVNNVDVYNHQGNHAHDSAQTTITVQVLGATSLPATGGMILIVFIITSVIVGGYYYIKSRKQLAKELLKTRML